VYSTFIAMFMVQEMDKKTLDNRALELINTVELEIKAQNNTLNFNIIISDQRTGNAAQTK